MTQIYEKLTDEELAMVEIIRHPIWCAEFVRNLPLKGDEGKWIHSQYQKEMLCDFGNYVVLCCARAIGKTEVLIDKVVWYALNLFYEESLAFTTPSKVHLEPPFFKLVRWLRHNPLLSHYVDRNSVNASSFNIKLRNGFVLDCRIAGKTNTGANLVGMHVPFVLMDEAGYYPWGTYIEMLPIINTFQDGYQLFVAGVPDGRREKSVLFNADQRDAKFNKHNIVAHDNPRYSDDDEERNINQFRGKNSEDYIHIVLGEHGQPVYAMFDRNMMSIQNYELHIDRIKGKAIENDPQFMHSLVATMPKLPDNYEDVMIGIDLGYTEPTVVHTMYKVRNKWYWLSRIVLEQVDYPSQEELIGLLDVKYNPSVIGIDQGSAGKSTVQHLLNDERWKSRTWNKKIFGIDFGGQVSVGLDEDGEEIKIRTKQFGMQKLQAMSNNHEIVFTNRDEEMIGELERTSYMRTSIGNITYVVEDVTGKQRRGDDHNTAALVCGILAWYQKFELNLNQKPKLLAQVKWLH